MVPLFVCLFICAYLLFLTLCWCLACWIFFLLKWKCVDVRAVLRIGTVASAWMSWTKPGAWGWRSFWLIILRRGETWTWASTRRSRTMRTRPSASLRCVCVWGYSHVSSAWAWTVWSLCCWLCVSWRTGRIRSVLMWELSWPVGVMKSSQAVPWRGFSMGLVRFLIFVSL